MANTVKNVIGKEARRREINELLVGTFNSILRVEEGVLRNRLTEGLTIAEIHTIHAIGLQGASPMNVVASRLNVTLATCTTAIGKLVDKGFVKRTRSDADRRQVLVSLTKEGRQAYRRGGGSVFRRLAENQGLLRCPRSCVNALRPACATLPSSRRSLSFFV